MRYVIVHETALAFATPVREHHCELRLAPRDDEYQSRLRATITVEPEARLRPHTDCFGNLVHAFEVIAPHDSLRTRLEAEVETKLANPFAYAAIPPGREDAWVQEALRASPPLWDFMLHRSTATPDLTRIAPELRPPTRPPGRAIVEAAQEAMAWVATQLDYRPGVTQAESPLAVALREGAGVCQDFAHLLIAVVRGWGVPARYVMGYVDPGYAEDGTSEAAAATHAWAEVLVPGAGWRGFDPVHGLVANDTYVPVAIGRDYTDAAPQRGTFKGEDPGSVPTVTLHVVPQQ